MTAPDKNKESNLIFRIHLRDAQLAIRSQNSFARQIRVHLRPRYLRLRFARNRTRQDGLDVCFNLDEFWQCLEEIRSI
jgi:hypothetical protein